MNAKNGKKKQRESGSLKIDPKVYQEAAEYCEKKGLKITFFATEAVTEKLVKEKSLLIQ